MSKSNEWCCCSCSPCRFQAERAAMVMIMICIVFDIGFFAIIYNYNDESGSGDNKTNNGYIEIKHQDNQHPLFDKETRTILTFRSIVDILLCALVMIGYYRRVPDFFLPYLVINTLILLPLLLQDIALIVCLIFVPQYNNAGLPMVKILTPYLIIFIVLLVGVFRAYKLVLNEQQMLKQSSASPAPAVVVFSSSTPTCSPPMYNDTPSYFEEV